MDEETKKDLVQETQPEEALDEKLQAQPPAERGEDLATEQATEDEQKPKDNHVAVRRGRLIAAGLLAAVILATVAVVVAGIFQFTSVYLRPCAIDLRVNDPSPGLWKDLTTEQTKSAPLGVPSKISGEAAWKRGQAASE